MFLTLNISCQSVPDNFISVIFGQIIQSNSAQDSRSASRAASSIQTLHRDLIFRVILGKKTFDRAVSDVLLSVRGLCRECGQPTAGSRRDSEQSEHADLRRLGAASSPSTLIFEGSAADQAVSGAVEDLRVDGVADHHLEEILGHLVAREGLFWK
jgi:hypothetical protein